MKVIGLMSGTSVDGIDVAVVEIRGAPPNLEVAPLSFTYVAFDAAQRQQVLSLFAPPTGTVDRICHANFALGERFAAATLQGIKEAGLDRGDIALVGSHGQTLYHAVDSDAPTRSTLQVGEAAVIAARTGITTISDFRVADVAAGGQGAPLVSYVDWLLLRHPERTRAVQNIGGIANVSYLPPGDSSEGVFAFDTGPGNMLIDDAARRATGGELDYDRDGEIAAQGRVDAELFNALMAHPYLRRAPPKTTGREEFGSLYGATVWEEASQRGLRPQEVVATLTAFTAASIADAYQRFLPRMPDQVVLGGGGAHNPTLVSMLQQRLGSIPVIDHEALGFSSDAKEAIAFAVLAYETIHGRPGNLPTCTGASSRTVLGKITPGRNFATLLPGMLPEFER
jgi:anhydro-N-acetylmuramic acid kinase